MGLDDIVDDHGGDASSSRSGSSSRNQKDDEDDLVKIGKPPYQKVFSEEKFEEVKKVLMHEMGYQPNVVLNSPAEKRYDILHEAATWSSDDFDSDDSSHRSSTRCIVCGIACDDTHVELEGEIVCTHHPAAKVRRFLDE